MVKIIDKVSCYECNSEYGLLLFGCPDGLNVCYCKKCVINNPKLHHLRRKVASIIDFNINFNKGGRHSSHD